MIVATQGDNMNQSLEILLSLAQNLAYNDNLTTEELDTIDTVTATLSTIAKKSNIRYKDEIVYGYDPDVPILEV